MYNIKNISITRFIIIKKKRFVLKNISILKKNVVEKIIKFIWGGLNSQIHPLGTPLRRAV